MSCREQKCAKNYNKWHSIYLFFKTAISICFRVLFDKIASVYFIWKIHLHFSIVNGQPREPVVSAHFRSLYHTCIATRGKSTASSCCLLLAVERCTERVLDSSSVSECPHNAAQSSHCKHLHIHSTLAISVTWPLTFSHTTHTHTQVSWYQKKHSPTHTHPGHQTSFINFLHLLQSRASSLFNLHAWQSFSTTSLQVLSPHIAAWNRNWQETHGG